MNRWIIAAVVAGALGLAAYSAFGQTPERRARKLTSFHLRATPTCASVGAELPTGTVLVLLAQAEVQPTCSAHANAILWQVRTPDGAVGWTYVRADEML